MILSFYNPFRIYPLPPFSSILRYNFNLLFFYLYSNYNEYVFYFFFLYKIFNKRKFLKIFKKSNKLFTHVTLLRKLVAPKNSKIKTLKEVKIFPIKTFLSPYLHFLHPLFFKNFLNLNKTSSWEIKGLNPSFVWWNLKSFNDLSWIKRFFKTFHRLTFVKSQEFKYFYQKFYYIKPYLYLPTSSIFEIKSSTNYRNIFTLNWIFKYNLQFLSLPGLRDILKTQREWQFDFFYIWKLTKIRFKKLLKKKKRKPAFVKLKIFNKLLLKNFSFFLRNFQFSKNFKYSNFSYFSNKVFLLANRSIKKRKKTTALYKFNWLKKKTIRIFKIKPTKRFFSFYTKNVFSTNKPNRFNFKKNYLIINHRPRSVLYRFSHEAEFLGDRPIYLKFNSPHDTPFICPQWGFFYISTWLTPVNYFQKLYLKLKVSMFSFFEKNDFYTFIMKNFLKTNYAPSLLSLTTSGVKSNYFKYPILNKKPIVLNDDKTSFFKWDFLRTHFSYKKNTSFFYNFGEHLWYQNEEKLNMKIKRIKFKPGYMNYWRECRKGLQTALSWKFTYQYNLTRYISKFINFVRYSLIKFFEMRLFNIVYLSKLIPIRHYTQEFIQHNCVYVNGVMVNNINFQIYQNDFIQFVIHLKLYFFYKYTANFLLKEKFYVKKVIHYKYKTLPVNKQPYSTLPTKLKNKFHFEYDIPKFLEVDFFTASIFVLSEPLLITDISIDKHFLNRFGVFNLYNWKYIT